MSGYPFTPEAIQRNLGTPYGADVLRGGNVDVNLRQWRPDRILEGFQAKIPERVSYRPHGVQIVFFYASKPRYQSGLAIGRMASRSLFWRLPIQDTRAVSYRPHGVQIAFLAVSYTHLTLPTNREV